jgi:hypothetical protein
MKSRSSTRSAAALAAGLVVLGSGSGCYHYTFQQKPESAPAAQAGRAQARVLVTYKERTPTYLNGFVGNGEVDTTKYCDEPVRTELRVTAVDVLLSVATLLIYTPHTLYVTCEARAPSSPVASAR